MMKKKLNAVDISDLKLILKREIEAAHEDQEKRIKMSGKPSPAHEFRVELAKGLIAKLDAML